MSVEDRLRAGLTRNAASFEPSVESALERVTARRRRRSHRRLALIAVGSAAALIGVLVAVQRPRDELAVSSESESSVSWPLSAQPLTGRFEATVDVRSVSGLQFDVAGRWVLEFDADGTMLVTAPVSYVGVVSGVLFQATADWFRSSLFESDLCSGLPLGIYRWVRTEHGLRFTEADDACAGRVAVLASQEWTAIG